MRYSRIVFNGAAIYGILVLLPQYFLRERIGVDFPPAITHAEYFYGFLGIALAWQLVFFIIARDPARYRLIMLPAIVEKLSFGFLAVWMYAQGALAGATFAGGLIDLLFAALFFEAFRRTR
jgi:hypothetical protein